MPEYQGTAHRLTDDRALASYLDTACWSNRPEAGPELYAHRLTKAARLAMAADWGDFLAANEPTIARLVKAGRYTYEQAAGDFWLSRNGHGAGFFDRGLGAAGDVLQRQAKLYGNADLYLGRNGWIHHA